MERRPDAARASKTVMPSVYGRETVSNIRQREDRADYVYIHMPLVFRWQKSTCTVHVQSCIYYTLFHTSCTMYIRKSR